MDQSLLVNGVHLALAAAGFGSILLASRSARFATWLWPLTIGASAIVAVFLFFVSDPGTIFEDFRKAYWVAGAALAHPPHNLEHVFEKNIMGFVNLPIVALIFAPFGMLDQRLAGALAAIPGGLAVLYSWHALGKICRMNSTERALLLFAFASFGPLIHSLRQGNMSHVVLALLLWGAVRVQSKPNHAGAAMALATLIKPPLALVGVYFVARQQWKVVVAFSAALAAIGALSILIFGWQLHVVWFDNCIRPFLQGVIASYNAQSLPATMARLENGPSVFADWTPYTLSPGARAMQIALSLAILASAVWGSLGVARAQFDLEFAMVLLLICLLSSLTWSHYYVWMLPALALLYKYTRPDEAPEFRPFLVAAYVFSAPAEFLSVPMREGDYPLASIFTSHMFIGGLIAFAALVGIRRRVASPGTPAALSESVS
jgi:alpha-1,2-mannosyltransferase